MSEREIFQKNFSMMIVGKPQSGKSTLIDRYLDDYWKFQFAHIVIVNKSEEYKSWLLCEWIKRTREQKKQYKEGKIDHISKIKLPFIEYLEDIEQTQEILDKYNNIERKHPPIDDTVFDKNYQEQLEKLIIIESSEHINRVQDKLKHTIVARPRTLIVFDNVVIDKYNRAQVENLILRARHLNMSIVITGCYLLDIPPSIRRNIDVVSLFYTTGTEKARIIKEYSIDPDSFDEKRVKPFSLRLIDFRNPRPELILTRSTYKSFDEKR